MRFLPFIRSGFRGLAVVRGTSALDLAKLGPGMPGDLDDVIVAGKAAVTGIEAALNGARPIDWAPLDEFEPAFPLARPGKVICLGLNYADHAKEGGYEVPGYPALFLRVRESMLSAAEPIVRPTCSERLDYEAELMVVIGRGGRHIREAEALEHVFGYTTFNDASIRDFQRRTHQWTPGKNFDATGPVGPVIVTADELPPGAAGLAIASRLNGSTMQSANTSDMLFPVARTVATVSEFTTLKPGDMIAMGTPQGVGHARTPPVWMKPGDSVEIEIERIGVLKSRIVAEGLAA